MSDGWRETTLGEIANISIGKTPPRKEPRYWTSDLTRPFCTIADMKNWNIDPQREGVTQAAEAEGKAKRVPAGALVMSFKLTIGRVGFAARDIFPNEAIAWIQPEEGVLPEYLALWLSNADLESSAGRAVKGKTLNGKSLRAIPVSVPPLKTQRRIVDLLGTVDAYILTTRARLKASGDARRALLQYMLDPNSAEGAEEAEWKASTLGDIADVVSGGTPKTSVAEYWGGDVLWVTPTEVVRNNGRTITSTDRTITEEGLRNSSARLLPKDAVLLTSRATIGAVALAGSPMATNQGFASLVCGKSVLPKFLMYWCQMNTHEFIARAGGNTFLEISRKRVAEVPICLPSLEVQQRVVRILEALDDEFEAVRHTLDATYDLREALLSELLSRKQDIPDSYDNLLGEAA